MLIATIELARLLGREHGQADMDHLLACPYGIEKLRMAYATLGRAQLLSGLEKSADLRWIGVAIADQSEQKKAYRDGYTDAAIDRIEALVFTDCKEW